MEPRRRGRARRNKCTEEEWLVQLSVKHAMRDGRGKAKESGVRTAVKTACRWWRPSRCAPRRVKDQNQARPCGAACVGGSPPPWRTERGTRRDAGGAIAVSAAANGVCGSARRARSLLWHAGAPRMNTCLRVRLWAPRSPRLFRARPHPSPQGPSTPLSPPLMPHPPQQGCRCSGST